MTTLAVKDALNTTQQLSVTVNPIDGGLVGSTAIADPSSGNKVTVSQLHNADKQNISGASQFGMLGAGTNLLIDPNGNADRQRETGFDNITAIGVATGSSQLLMQLSMNSGTGAVGAAGAATITPAAMSGTFNGVPWSIQAGTPIVYDLNGANQENIIVSSVTSTTFTAQFAKTHSAGVTMLVNVYNQQRDAAGESSGASGQGTSVAVTYEDISGGPLNASSVGQGFNYDPEKNVQGKGVTSQALSSTPSIGATSISFSSQPVGLRAGAQIVLTGGTAEVVYVAKSYTTGTTVPLQAAIVNGSHSTAQWDSFAVGGPGRNTFYPNGIGVDAIALYDPISGQHIELGNHPGSIGAAMVSTEGVRATYRVAASAITPAASTTDIVTLTGSASKTIRVKSIRLTGTATTAGTMPVSLIRRSAANSGGTSTTPTIMKHDTSDGSASAVVTQYSANASSLGTTVGTLAVNRLWLNLSTGAPYPVVFDFATRNDKAIVLRGTTDILAINLGGASVPTGGVIDYEIEWEEDAS